VRRKFLPDFSEVAHGVPLARARDGVRLVVLAVEYAGYEVALVVPNYGVDAGARVVRHHRRVHAHVVVVVRRDIAQKFPQGSPPVPVVLAVLEIFAYSAARCLEARPAPVAQGAVHIEQEEHLGFCCSYYLGYRYRYSSIDIRICIELGICLYRRHGIGIELGIGLYRRHG